MGNCLVTQLRGQSDNESLSYFGKVGIKLSNASGLHTVKVTINAGDKIYFKGTQQWYVNGSLPSSNVYVAPSNGDYGVQANNSSGDWMILVDKYNLKAIKHEERNDTIDIIHFDDLAESPDFNYIKLNNRLDTNNVEGNIESLKGNITFLGITGSLRLTGNIGNLNYDKDCLDMEFTKCPNISGNVEDVLLKLYNAGRRNSNFKIIIGGTGATGSKVRWHGTFSATYIAVFVDGQITVYVNDASVSSNLRGTWTPGGGWVYTM